MAASQERLCTKCGKQKPLSDFHKHPLGKHGRFSRCKPCIAVLDSARHLAARLANPNKVKAVQTAWRRANPLRMKEFKRRHYLKTAAYVKAKSQTWNEQNAERRRKNQQAWRDRNRETVRISQRRARKKLRSTAKGQLHLSVGSTLRAAIKSGTKKGRRTFELLGYSVQTLMVHLEKQFQPGMTWANYGRYGWHIDHIIPIAAFNFESPDDIDFKRAWELRNLRPLWAHDNHTKSKKLLEPFQPSLLIRNENNLQNRGT